MLPVFCVIAAGCGREPGISYLYDARGLVESASAARGEAVVATARRMGIAPSSNPMVADIAVEETHFRPGSREIVYRGEIVFRCRTNQEFCEQLSVTRREGKRPRDVFRRWPYATTGLSTRTW